MHESGDRLTHSWPGNFETEILTRTFPRTILQIIFGYVLITESIIKVLKILGLGPALMAVWSKALPLTASCLSGFKFWPGYVRRLPVTWR